MQSIKHIELIATAILTLLASSTYSSRAQNATVIAQQAYIKASNTGANDRFGGVAISGDTMVVSAEVEDSNATGVNGNQSDNSSPDAGAAYIFVRDGTNWIQRAYLKTSNTGANDNFAWSVGISGDTVMVGAPQESSNATGVNGNQSDNSSPSAGAAYVFVRNGTNWSQQAYPQRYEMDWRVWNGGTTRVLLWADPEYVRRYSEATLIYDSPNWDVQEPLATKMEAQRPDMPTFALMPEKYRHYDYEFERYWHFFQVWGRVGYNPQTPAEPWEHEFQTRFGTAGRHVQAGLHRASQVLPMIVASVYPYRLFPTTRGWAERQSLGPALADYARNEGTDVEQFESFADAAKRIMDGRTTTKRTPEATSRWLDESADAVLTSVRAAEAGIGEKRSQEFEATIVDLQILARLARFHGRRAIAAVHYNLFKRTDNPAELLAAINEERSAVAAWRELVATAGDHYHSDLAMGARNFSLCGHWRDELVKLEGSLKQLEAQGATAAGAKGKVWQPAARGDLEPPRVESTRIRTARPGEPLRISARVTDPSGVQSVRLRYRHVTQFEDYLTLDLQPSGEAGMFATTVPGDFLVPQWNFMYFLEVTDKAGNGANWPDLATQMPYVIVKLER